MVGQTSARKMVTCGWSRPTRGFYQALWEPPLSDLLSPFCAVRGPGDTEISGAQQIHGSATTIQRATLTDLRSVWSGSKDLSVDWRVKLLPVLLLHRSRVIEFL